MTDKVIVLVEFFILILDGFFILVDVIIGRCVARKIHSHLHRRSADSRGIKFHCAVAECFVQNTRIEFAVEGIIKSYSYALTVYISEDNPDLTPEECINKSIEMMNGNKWKLFLLDLSFIGWFFLSILTLGIALLWFRPYLETARIYFYEDLKSSLETKAIEE